MGIEYVGQTVVGFSRWFGALLKSGAFLTFVELTTLYRHLRKWVTRSLLYNHLPRHFGYCLLLYMWKVHLGVSVLNDPDHDRTTPAVSVRASDGGVFVVCGWMLGVSTPPGPHFQLDIIVSIPRQPESSRFDTPNIDVTQSRHGMLLSQRYDGSIEIYVGERNCVDYDSRATNIIYLCIHILMDVVAFTVRK